MKKISSKILFEGQWLSLCETAYENKDGIEVKWESVQRKKPWVGVVIIAKLVPSNRYILIKQHRPAIDGYILGFPAGLADDGNPNEGLRELKEETGYTGKVMDSGPILKSNSGIVNDAGRTIIVEVDETDPVNANPQQELEPTEDIEVCLVPREDMKTYLMNAYEQGIHIGSNLWYLFCVEV